MSSSPVAEFVDSAINVLIALEEISPGSSYPGPTSNELKRKLKKWNDLLRRHPQMAFNDDTLKIVQSILQTYQNFACIVPELENHSAYQGFLQSVKSPDKRVPPKTID